MLDRRIGVFSIAIGLVTAALTAPVALGQGGMPLVRPNRADLAASYLAFEEALAATTLTGRAQRRVHRGFDHAASLFFAGRLGEAIERMDELTLLVERHAAGDQSEVDGTGHALRSLAVHIHPAAHSVADPQQRTPRATIFSTYPAAVDERLALALVSPEGEEVWRREFALIMQRRHALQKVEIDGLPADLPAGTYRAVLIDQAGRDHAAGRLSILSRSADRLGAELAVYLESARHNAAKDDADLQRAIRIGIARLRLLKSNPSPLNSIEFLLDPPAHARELEEEITALLAGRNPYANRPGEHWRIVDASAGHSPMMVYAPQSIAQGEPLPLIIALHGAGGDETLFMRAYGAGMIRDLAESRGFVVASPLTYHLADGSLIDRIIEDLCADYAIDRDRIYLIGHSLGGGATSVLLNAQPERYAAAVCIAGAGPFMPAGEDAAYPPVRVIAAELDTIITPQRLREIADAGIERGLPIEYRLADNLGHVLVVNEVLEEAIEWLLTNRR